MLWSSFYGETYAIGTAYSENGICGPWVQEAEPLYIGGGHGMVFRKKDGTLWLSIHSPNETPKERALFLPLEEKGGKLVRK